MVPFACRKTVLLSILETQFFCICALRSKATFFFSLLSIIWKRQFVRRENNEERKENILWAMNKYGWLTDEEYEEALAQELVLQLAF